MNHAARSRERQLSALTPPPPLYATAVVGYRAWMLYPSAYPDDEGPSGWGTIEEMITWTAAEQRLVRRAAEYYRVPYVRRHDLAAEALVHGDPAPTLEEIQ